jgi:uncharacterized repeat protein (TIGR01451 family)
VTTVRTTGRWRGIAAVGLFFLAVGVLTTRPPVLLAGIIGAGYAAYPRVAGPPTAELAIDRRIADIAPQRGDTVAVTTKVTNTGDSTLFDCRIIDGVPPQLTVTSGSPRHAAVLRPGRTATIQYTVETEYGRHQFDPATVIVRDITGTHEIETNVTTDTELTCADTLSTVPLGQQPDGHAGQRLTDLSGDGIEFHSVREYHPGDPIGRIDSNRLARTGELTTVEFREERSTSVVILIDAREPAYRSQTTDEPSAVSHSIAGAEQIIETLGETRDAVGLAVLGSDLEWLAPNVGPDHKHRMRQWLVSHLSARPPDPTDCVDVETQTDQLRQRLHPTTQLLILSPLTDKPIVRTIQTLAASGFTTTVVSPDVTTGGSVGRRFARTARTARIDALRRAAISVVDWDPTTPLGIDVLSDFQRREPA